MKHLEYLNIHEPIMMLKKEQASKQINLHLLSVELANIPIPYSEN